MFAWSSFYGGSSRRRVENDDMRAHGGSFCRAGLWMLISVDLFQRSPPEFFTKFCFLDGGE